MSSTATRKEYRNARRARCSAYLSQRIHAEPGIIPPDVALRFLTHGHHERDLDKFLASYGAAKAMPAAPEHFRKIGRGLLAQVLPAVMRKKKIIASIAQKHRQRIARRISRLNRKGA